MNNSYILKLQAYQMKHIPRDNKLESVLLLNAKIKNSINSQKNLTQNYQLIDLQNKCA